MYADNLFTLNNVPTLSAGAAFDENALYAGDAYPVGCADVLFASVVQLGKAVLEKSFRGFRSLDEVMAEIIRNVDSTSGLVTVHLRNRSRGWSVKRTVRVRRRAVSMFAAFA